MTSTQIPAVPHQLLYDTDFVQWINQTAELLKQGRFDELDIENLIEEVESLGRSEKSAVRSNLRVLLMHLLQWQYQPSQRSGSWKGSIREHRKRIQYALKDSPSLKNHYTAVFEESYITARLLASDETELPLEIFPVECPYTPEQVLDEEFWPQE